MKNNIVIFGAFLIIFILIFSGCLNENNISFVTISRSTNCGHEERKNYVINNSKDWQDLWNIVYSISSNIPDLPDINFNQSVVLAAFQGTKSTGGYSIEITEIIKKENCTSVYIKETFPDPGSHVTEALTNPYHIVKMQKTDKTIVFNYIN